VARASAVAAVLLGSLSATPYACPRATSVAIAITSHVLGRGRDPLGSTICGFQTHGWRTHHTSKHHAKGTTAPLLGH
jgi:hypothetical protein